MGKITLLIAMTVLRCFAESGATSQWFVARSPHFEVYSQAGPERARSALARFEEFRSFFDRNHVVQAGSGAQKKTPLRVIGFSSQKQYDSFKLRATADAYYSGTADRDYIVMPMSGTDDFAIAAHEYAHYVLHSGGLNLPAWLNEGIAELFSTVRIANRQTEFGGPLSARVATLRQRTWLTAAELLKAGPNSPVRETRAGAAVFYAESWALVDMLTSSAEYAPRFGELVAVLNLTDISSEHAFSKVYGKPADAVLRDARDWVLQAKSSRRTLPSISPDTFTVELSPVPEPEAKAMIADLLFANGEWDRAERIYQELLTESPESPEILGCLGNVALRKGDRSRAAEYWRKALDHDVHSAVLCYRFALLAEEMQMPVAEVKRALERAVALQPELDDARYKLALLKSSAGEYAAAAGQLQAMAKPPVDRAYAYWTALAYALSEAGKRDEAESAARKAMECATNADERGRAAALAYTAKTDLTVRFTRDANGELQLETTRVPHGSTDFNPFVEPGDHIEVTTGKLREVKCSEGRLTGFVVESEHRTLALSVPDPTHVLIRNGPPEYYCGPQSSRDVKVEYAAAAKSDGGLLRGMTFQ